MDKINFVNNSAPDLSAEILNQMQDNMEEAIEKKYNYSTEEQVIGTWTNGKPLYRRVLTLNTVGNQANLSSAMTYVDKVIKFDGLTLQPNGDTTSINYYLTDDDKCSCFFRASTKQFVLDPGREYGFGQVTLIVEYTKTTD